MAAYLIAQVGNVTDPAAMREYAQRVGATIEPFGGKVRVVPGQVDVLEGTWRPALAIVEFDSVERAQAWYDSDEYRPVKELRQGAADLDLIIVRGI